MAEAAQAALEAKHPTPPLPSAGSAQQSQWRSDAALSPPPPPPPPPQLPHLRSTSSSVESTKWLKVAEAMAGLRGWDGRGVGGGLVREVVGGVADGVSGLCRSVGEWRFSGAAAVRWLLDEGLAASASAALYAGQRLLEEGHIHLLHSTAAAQPHPPLHTHSTAPAAAADVGTFYLSSSLWYAFDASLRWDDAPVSAADVERLRLNQQPHPSIIAQLCQHYNHRAAAAEPPSPLRSSLTPSSAGRRSAVWPDGYFLGVELVRWLRHRRLIERSRDGMLWGNFLLQRDIIVADYAQPPRRGGGATYTVHSLDAMEEQEETETARGSAPQSRRSAASAPPPSPPPPLGFRLGAARYRMQASRTEETRNSKGEGRSSRGAAPSTLSSASPSSSPSAAAVLSASPLMADSLPPPSSPWCDPLISVAELRRPPSFLNASPSASAADGGCGDAAMTRDGGAGGADSGVVGGGGGWEFVQSFGDEASSYDFADADDLVTAVEFDHTGEYLAIGDKAGRVSIVEEAAEGRSGVGWGGCGALEYRFYTEFQAHQPEFDSLKSTEVSPRITALEWLRHPHTSTMLLLTSNERSVQLYKLDTKHTHHSKAQRRRRWREPAHAHSSRTPRSSTSRTGSHIAPDLHQRVIGEKDIRPLPPFAAPSFSPQSTSLSLSVSVDEVGGGGGSDGVWGGVDADVDVVAARCVRSFRGVHQCSVHSVSSNCDGSTFLSADDLQLLLFDVQHSHTAVGVVDVSGGRLREGLGDRGCGGVVEGGAVDELLTVARFHPSHPSLLCHGSSTGLVRLVDLRLRFTWDSTAVASFTAATLHSTAAAPPASHSNGSQPLHSTALPIPGYYRSITDSISDLRWTVGGAASGGGSGGVGSSGSSSGDVRYVVTRDYLLVRVWDLRHLLYPVYVSHVHPHLLASLPQLLESEALFDSFQLAVAPDGRQLVTGTYSNSFTLHDTTQRTTTTIHCQDDARLPHITHSLHNPPLHTHVDALLSAHSLAVTPPPPLPPAALPLSIVRSYAPPLPLHPSTSPTSAQSTAASALSSASPVLSPASLLPPSSPSLPALPSAPPAAVRPLLLPSAPFGRLSVAQRVLKVAWHPHRPAVACASLYKLFLYQCQQRTTPHVG